MTVKTSLIMTVYNRERYVETAIKSVLAQTQPDFELLIWDDGSSDRSLQIAYDYAHIDRRIRVFAAKHRGRVQSLRQAHDQAQGTYVAWMDSDDWLAPTALAETEAILDQRPEVGMVYTHHDIMDADGRLLGLGKRCKIPYSPQRLLVDFMVFHFRLFRRSLHEQVGSIDVSIPYAVDYDLCLKLSEVGEIYALPVSLYRYRQHDDSISWGKRLEQIDCSRRSIEQALQRRGLSDRYEIQVELVGRFQLRSKSGANAGANAGADPDLKSGSSSDSSHKSASDSESSSGTETELKAEPKREIPNDTKSGVKSRAKVGAKSGFNSRSNSESKPG
jgi:glycosyltransferase involved in cell wall biosynthesis